MSYQNKSAFIIFITAPSQKEAKLLASGLIEKRLAACVNLIAPVRSMFTWNNKVTTAKEVLMIVKTMEKQFQSIKKYIESNHSYEVPEIVGFKIGKGNKSYLNWLHKCVS